MSQIISQLKKELSLSTHKKNVSIGDLEASEQAVEAWKSRPRIQEDPEVRAIESELPGFILYLTALQSVVLFGGMIREHPLLKDLNDQISKAEGLYEKGASADVVTASFFNSWEFFDVYFGNDEGTLGSLYLEFTEDFHVPAELTEVIGRCCASRLGVYQHLGKRGETMELQDLATGSKLRAMNPRGYLGRKGEIWLVRLYPGIAPNAFLAMTTPYVIRKTTPEQWEVFFKGLGIHQKSSESAVRLAMRFPKKPLFWFEYIDRAAVRRDLEVDHFTLEGMPSLKS